MFVDEVVRENESVTCGSSGPRVSNVFGDSVNEGFLLFTKLNQV